MPVRFVVLPAVALAGLAACCLQPSEPGLTSGGSSTSGGGTCPGTVPVNHRPLAVACDGGNTNPLPGETNQCLDDADCLAKDAGTRVCSCAPATRQFSGSTVDWCVPGDCTTDSDCACGYCSPTYDPNCGSFFGFDAYYCHTTADTCVNDGDCDGGYCAYSPQISHWACGYGRCAG